MAKLHFVLISGLVLLLSQCTVFQQIPEANNVPLFTQRNELKVNVGIYDNYIAYSFGKHFGAMTSYNWRKLRNNGFWQNGGKEGARRDKRHCILQELNIAFVYYVYQQPFYFEVFGGAGYGTIQYGHTATGNLPEINYEYNFTANPFKLFIQPVFGKHINKKLEIAVALRFCAFQYTKLNCTYSGYSELIGEPKDLLISDNTNYNLYYLQPSFTFRTGNEYVKMQLQAGYNSFFANDKLNAKKAYLQFSCYVSIPFERKNQLKQDLQ